MSKHEFDNKCEGCRPVLWNPETGKCAAGQD